MAASGECGRLRIGIHALIPRSFLAELIAQYREVHPGIKVEITEGTARDAVMQLRADRLNLAFVVGSPELPDCLPARSGPNRLSPFYRSGIRLPRNQSSPGPDLVGETFLVRYGGTGPQVHYHIVLRLAGRWPVPSILRFDVGRGTLLSMVGQGFGITIVGAARSMLPTTGIVFLPLADEPEPIPFSAVWSPCKGDAERLRQLEDERDQIVSVLSGAGLNGRSRIPRAYMKTIMAASMRASNARR